MGRGGEGGGRKREEGKEDKRESVSERGKT